MVERSVHIGKVEGSNPSAPTLEIIKACPELARLAVVLAKRAEAFGKLRSKDSSHVLSLIRIYI